MITAAECATIESLIRAGRVYEARTYLQTHTRSQVPRPLFAKTAELCRRAGLFNASIRLLSKVIRSERELDAEPSPQELTEYALALVKVGAIDEGRELLRSVDANKAPLAPFFMALTYFPEWDYEAALPLLESFVTTRGIDPYQCLVGKVNLTSALLQLSLYEKAGPLLIEGLRETDRPEYRLLHANFLELSAQHALKQARFDEAIQFLERSSPILSKSGLFDELFVRKWLCLVNAYRNPKGAEGVEQLRAVRDAALSLSHWETLRDLDFHTVNLQRDSGLYHHLYHGTPHAKYRAHLRRVFADLPAPLDIYDWQLGVESAGRTDTQQAGQPRRFDLRSASFDGALTGLKTGQLLHRLLLQLSADFYRPARIATIASSLFAGQYYDPIAMPSRLHQLVKRLRKWLVSEDIPIVIEEANGAYQLKASEPIILAVGTDTSTDDRENVDATLKLNLSRLRGSIPDVEFTAKEVATSLSCSASKALRIVNAGIVTGDIEKVGAAAQRRYRFAS